MQGFIQKDFAKVEYFDYIVGTNDLGFSHEFWIYAGARVFCVLFPSGRSNYLRYFLYRREQGDNYEVHLKQFTLIDQRTVYHIDVPNLRIVLVFNPVGVVEFYEDFTEAEWKKLTEYFQPTEFSNYPIVFTKAKTVTDDLGTIVAIYTEENERVYTENYVDAIYSVVNFTFYRPDRPRESVSVTRGFVLPDGHALKIQPPPSQQAISVYDVHSESGVIRELCRFRLKE